MSGAAAAIAGASLRAWRVDPVSPIKLLVPLVECTELRGAGHGWLWRLLLYAPGRLLGSTIEGAQQQ